MKVSAYKSKNYKESFLKIFDDLDFVCGKRVFVKPNLSAREPILPGENTSVEVLVAFIEALKERYEVDDIIIGHGALLGSFDHSIDLSKMIKDAGFDVFEKMDKVRILNIDTIERQELKGEDMKFHLPIKYFEKEIDTYVDFAKIKTHMEAGVSFCLKNQMGIPMPIDRVMMHKTDLQKNIAILNSYIKSDLNILEGCPAMEGQGPHHGKAIELDLITASKDIVTADSFTAQLLGYDFKTIKHLVYSEGMGLGKFYDGENFEEYKKLINIEKFEKASDEYKYGLKLFAYPTYSCSRCISAVNKAGHEFKKHPFKYRKVIWKIMFSKERMNIIFGRADELDLKKEGRFICIGNCSKQFAEKHNCEFLDKCPPGIDEARDYIIKGILNKKKK